ncbi:uncharacterized protein LOC129984987 [Argiope bruennichi]|uniref:uncharacterized protein LOC129984987 n=1 Tax=Argiope bruennichi TaxID=94029 RepID=UPI002493D984|nr:uncharacterized protein LOC129984987 [Argiope bruennichi]
MDTINRRYRKLKGRPSKRKRMCSANISKRWNKNVAENSENVVSVENSVAIEEVCIDKNKKSFSASAKKLGLFPSTSSSTSNVTEKNSYIMMNNDMWSSLLSNIKCSECDMCSLDVESNGEYGFSTKIELKCKNCNKIFSSIFSSPREKDSKCFEANKKLVEAFLKIGKGHAALEIFSMAIGIHAMDKKTFSKCLHQLYDEKQTHKDDILEVSRKIVRKKHQELSSAVEENLDDAIDITVSYDGTWQKRGHSSLYGIGIIVDILTGLIIDFEIISKYCPECTTAKRDLGEKSPEFSIWYKTHKSDCSKNYMGSLNSMETKAAEILWKRSIKNCGMRYVSVVSDGDAKTYQHVSELNVYGEDVEITKEECVNHVAKRLGTGLRKKVKECQSKGITLGGRKVGSLKESTILKLTNYYRKAIKENVPDVQKMKSAIFASLFHCSSTDKTPKHSKCPTGSTSWCFYQRALANNEEPKSHSTMKTKLSELVLEKILPIYQRLANNELLARCASGKTQNANESIHSIIWKNCPKEIFVSKKRLEMAVITSVGEYNFGCFNNITLEQSGFNAASLDIAQRRDKRRIAQSENRSSDIWKKKRIEKKIAKSVKTTKNIKKEGKTYGSGKF